MIAPQPVDDFVPLSRAADGNITTQYTMVTLEELGLLKMDFLGLRTLTVIQNAIGGRFDVHDIDYDDPEVFDMIGKGQTEGVFQLESAGMRNFMKEFPCTARGRWTLSPITLREKTIRTASGMTARNWSRSFLLLMAVSYTKSK